MNKIFSIQTLTSAFALAALTLGAHSANATCQLGNPAIQHVVYIQFDNVHSKRDNPNVPADLEQMPNLLNFIQSKGSYLTNHHTPLISHTGDDILTSMTGVYGDRHGQPVSNSYGYFNPSGTVGFVSSYAYWTDASPEASAKPIMVNENGLVAAAPWIPYTRAGCDVGQVSVANTVLENTTSDITTVFGTGSPEATEAASNSALATADFEGIAVHCGFNSALCTGNPNARTDKLRSEAGGYAGYQALFGHKYVAATISPAAPLADLNGNPINDGLGHNGFPGFGSMVASTSLGYAATMLEKGIPVVYAYIADLHDSQVAGAAPCNALGSSAYCAYGPGEAGYVAAAASYNTAFGQFFSRLKSDGIDETNTLFIITTDEEDFFAGTQNPTPAGCDGVTTPCVYNHTPTSASARNVATVGEINVNLSKLLATEKADTTAFSVHSDLPPTFYLKGNPAQTATTTRQLERDVAGLTTFNGFTGVTEPLVDYIADQAGMSMLHMVTSDSTRTPTFVAFEKGYYYGYASGTSPCTETNYTDCVNIESEYAWNHGGYQSQITHIWLGMVGPGITAGNLDSTTFTDHVDIRPTMLTLLGMQDTYQHDGRVIIEALQDSALPVSMAGANRSPYQQLAQSFKSINAAMGPLGQATLAASTYALTGNDTNDSTYTNCTAKIVQWVATRNSLAAQMKTMLEYAAFQSTPVTMSAAQPLINQANALIASAVCP